MTSVNNWLTYMGNMQRTGHADDVLSPPLRLAWQFHIGGHIWTSPVVIAGRVYLPADRLYCLRLDNGELIWQTDPINAFGGAIAATYWQDTLFVCGIQQLFAIDASTGAVNFQVDSKSNHSTPCLHQGNVYWVAGNGTLYAADSSTGDIKWTYSTGKNTHFTPAVANNTICVGSYGSLYALEATTGTMRWRHDFFEDYPRPEIRQTVAVGQDKLFAAVTRNGVFALEIETGETQWHYPLSEGPFTVPCLAENDIFVAGRQLYALRADTGQSRWVSDTRAAFDNSSPILSGDTIYIGGGNTPALFGFNRTNGNQIWLYEMADFVFSTPVVAQARLLVGCHDGYLYCFEKE